MTLRHPTTASGPPPPWTSPRRRVRRRIRGDLLEWSRSSISPTLEERLAGRALALMGGLALILGAVFFLSLAFSRGWIGPDMQVLLGLAGGAAALLVGGVLLLRGDRIVGHVLTAVGLAVISLALFAAVSVYALLAAGRRDWPATLVAAAVATAIAVASRSQIVAGFGLVAVLAAPPILGADADILTLVYLAIVLSGVAVVSLWQTWSWLPPTAFVLSAPQVYAVDLHGARGRARLRGPAGLLGPDGDRSGR